MQSYTTCGKGGTADAAGTAADTAGTAGTASTCLSFPCPLSVCIAKDAAVELEQEEEDEQDELVVHLDVAGLDVAGRHNSSVLGISKPLPLVLGSKI